MKARRCWETKSRFRVWKRELANRWREREREGRKGQMNGCVVIHWPLIWHRGSGCVRELMEGMICETPWWVEFLCLCACQHGLPRTSGSHPKAREARPRRFWHGDLKPRLACVHVCVCVSTPYVSTWWLCAWMYLQLSFHMWACACTAVSEIDSRWSKDVQQRKGPAGSNCTEYSVYYQQHNRFKATCSLTVSITVTSYTLKRYSTTKVEINNRTHLS